MNFKEYKQLVHAPKAAKMASDKWYCLERNISAVISWILLKIFPGVRPNCITTISLVILSAVLLLSFLAPKSVYIFILQLILLYSITITDKIDGEIARAKNISTQKGIYYDYTVHLFYPFIFYLAVANYFYSLVPNNSIFYLTIFLGLVTLIFIIFRSTVLLVADTIKTKNLVITDWVEGGRKISWPWAMRFLDYLTFMIYAWTLVFYLILAVISLKDYRLAYFLYAIHINCTLLFLLYRILWSYPRNKLMKRF